MKSNISKDSGKGDFASKSQWNVELSGMKHGAPSRRGGWQSHKNEAAGDNIEHSL